MFRDAKVGLPYGSGFYNSQGYRVLYRPDNYDCDGRGYVRLHRYKYSLVYGVVLKETDVIHHLDGNKQNNMKPNLILTNKVQHDCLIDNLYHKKVRRLARKLFMSGMKINDIAKAINRNRNSTSVYVSTLWQIRKDVWSKRITRLRSLGATYREVSNKVGIPLTSVYFLSKEATSV